ncbi:MAG: PepSY-associated TM helix domain-containing protein [Tsuneonella sp.]
MRTALLLVHRYSGLATLAFLALAALTGCLLVFRGPIDRALNQDLFKVSSTVAAGPAQTVAAVEAYAAARPGIQVTSFPLNVPAGRALEIAVTGRPGAAAPAQADVFLDPVSGAVLGARDGEAGWDRRRLVKGISEVHFDLLAGTWGRWFLGVVALLWFVSSLAGLYLTFPEKGPFWRKWWRTWQFRRSSAWPRLLLDLHRASGLWLLPFLLLLAATSVALNFFAEAWSPLATSISPLKHDLFDQTAPYPQGATPKLSFAQGLAAARAHARGEGLEWQPATMLYLPEWNFYGVKFSADGMLSYDRLGPVDYYVDANSAAYRHQVDPYADSMGLKLIRVLYPLHSGEVFGLATVALVFLLGLVTFGQSLTGLYVWWKKRASRVAARRNARRKAAA